MSIPNLQGGVDNASCSPSPHSLEPEALAKVTASPSLTLRALCWRTATPSVKHEHCISSSHSIHKSSRAFRTADRSMRVRRLAR